MPHETSPHHSWDRRTFLRRTAVTVVGAGVLSGTAAADHNQEFPLRPWHDGIQWESGKITTLDDPNENTLDDLWGFPKTEGVTSTRCPDGGCPVNQWGVVREAPGDPGYNGGRWVTHSAIVEKPDEYEENWQPIQSEAEVMDAKMAGVIRIEDRTFDPGPPRYFSCPMINKID